MTQNSRWSAVGGWWPVHAGPRLSPRLPVSPSPRLAVLLYVFVSLCLCVERAAAHEADPPFERGLELIRNELLIARTGLRALSVAAHPDDEDGGTLSYLRRTLGVETHICLATRGEGGQNESGPELGADLAVLRTRETEAACAILGAKAWYLNLPDFGYSKSPEEALRVWGHDNALERLVRVIRIVRPHIIFTNHNPDGTDHGHHVAVGKLVIEAFDAAADPKKFPERMKEDGTQPWQASKLYLRRFAPPGAMLSFDISAREGVVGLSAPEIAAFALSKHASQGMSREVKAGEKEMRYFTLLKSHLGAAGDDTSLISGIPLEAPEALQKTTFESLKATKPADCAQAFVHLLAENAKADPTAIAHLQKACAEALGLKVEPFASYDIITYDNEVNRPGDVHVIMRVSNTGNMPVNTTDYDVRGESPKWRAIGTVGVLSGNSGRLEPGGSYGGVYGGVDDFTIEVAPDAFPTFPYSDYIGSRIESRSPLQAVVAVSIKDSQDRLAHVTLRQSVPLDLAAPRRAVVLPDPVLIFDDPSHGDTFLVLSKFKLAVTNYRRMTEPLTLYAGIQSKVDAPTDRSALTFHHEDETLTADFRFMAPVEQLNKGDVDVPLNLWTAEKNFGGPVAHLRRVPIKLPPTLNVGLVKTYDDSTYTALKNLADAGLGLSVTLLPPADLLAADLNKFHTIVLDIRATQYRPDLRHMKERLMQFMRDGGNVVCMYQKDFDWNSREADPHVRGAGFFKGEGGGGEIAPYPIELSFDRVTDETAPMRILKPDHPLLLEPCKIWERDFEGWVQERGVYFPKKWAPEYTALLSSNDPGEKPLDGGLLVADVGAGSFIYTSFVWYRQLRAGNVGAYRMLANLISYPRVKRTK